MNRSSSEQDSQFAASGVAFFEVLRISRRRKRQIIAAFIEKSRSPPNFKTAASE
jgi:hypothetical protein